MSKGGSCRKQPWPKIGKNCPRLAPISATIARSGRSTSRCSAPAGARFRTNARSKSLDQREVYLPQIERAAVETCRSIIPKIYTLHLKEEVCGELKGFDFRSTSNFPLREHWFPVPSSRAKGLFATACNRRVRGIGAQQTSLHPPCPDDQWGFVCLHTWFLYLSSWVRLHRSDKNGRIHNPNFVIIIHYFNDLIVCRQ